LQLARFGRPTRLRTLLAKMGDESVQDLLDTHRRQVIGRISQLLWRSLKDASGSQAQIWPAANTVTEPIGTDLVHLALRKFLK
jgi:hypothetical protein